MRSIALALLLVAGCADARDLFMPYQSGDVERRERDEMLAHARPAAPIDAALVLGCPAELDGSPSLCQRCRVKSAVRAWKRGAVRNLIFSGTAAHSADVEADVMGDLAERRGVPKVNVFREGRALTTWQNVRFALEIARRNGFRTFLVVSTSDHLARARRILDYYGVRDERVGYVACDLDLPHDSDAEWQKAPPVDQPIMSE
jgi:uncharacterized SAM-binding protein YcdF (DUF218 family)